MEQINLKRLELNDCQKQLLEAQAKLRRQQSLFEEVRSERNNFKKNYLTSEADLNEAKNKIKSLNQQLTQLDDRLQAKDAELAKNEFCMYIKKFFFYLIYTTTKIFLKTQ